MKIPDKIKIGGHWIKIIYPYRFSERSDRAADQQFEMKQIRICDIDENGHLYPIDASVVNLIHETLHVANYTLGEGVFDESPEGERRCSAFAELIYQILIDNNFISIEGE